MDDMPKNAGAYRDNQKPAERHRICLVVYLVSGKTIKYEVRDVLARDIPRAIEMELEKFYRIVPTSMSYPEIPLTNVHLASAKESGAAVIVRRDGTAGIVSTDKIEYVDYKVLTEEEADAIDEWNKKYTAQKSY